MKFRLPLLIGTIGGLFLTLTGLPIDAYRAFRGTEPGDRMRLYHYYRTARLDGVPAALERYGVSPNTKGR